MAEHGKPPFALTRLRPTCCISASNHTTGQTNEMVSNLEKLIYNVGVYGPQLTI